MKFLTEAQSPSNQLLFPVFRPTVSIVFCFTCLAALVGASYGQDDPRNDSSKSSLRDGNISDQEYKDGMEQKQLHITNAEEAFREESWDTCSSIAIGDGYSVVMQFRQAHPLVAEYHRRALLFAGDERRGKLIGSLQLRMNFGGRTYIMLYRHLDKDGKVTHLSFEPRDEVLTGGQSVRLVNPDFEEPPKSSKKEYVGLVSGEAYPLKFFTPLIVSEKSARERMK